MRKKKVTEVSVLRIDLGKNSCSVVGLDGTGRVVVRKRMRRETVITFAASLAPCVVTMEACCGAHHQLSEVSPITINAAVWRGKSDNEAVASVMDDPDHLDLAWLTFSLSEEPALTTRFRDGSLLGIWCAGRKHRRSWPLSGRSFAQVNDRKVVGSGRPLVGRLLT